MIFWNIKAHLQWCTSSNKATPNNHSLFKQCQSLVTKNSNACAYGGHSYSNYRRLGFRFSVVSLLEFQLWYRNDSFPVLFYFLLLPQFLLLFHGKFASLTLNCPWIILFSVLRLSRPIRTKIVVEFNSSRTVFGNLKCN